MGTEAECLTSVLSTHSSGWEHLLFRTQGPTHSGTPLTSSHYSLWILGTSILAWVLFSLRIRAGAPEVGHMARGKERWASSPV